MTERLQSNWPNGPPRNPTGGKSRALPEGRPRGTPAAVAERRAPATRSPWARCVPHPSGSARPQHLTTSRSASHSQAGPFACARPSHPVPRSGIRPWAECVQANRATTRAPDAGAGHQTTSNEHAVTKEVTGMHAAQEDAMEMRARAQRYTGPSAGRIAKPRPAARSRFERGWFRTTTAVCHDGDEPDGLAFRQRPDGNGIDVRCHTGGCTRGHVVTALEGVVGLPIWTAYEPVPEAEVEAPRRRWPGAGSRSSRARRCCWRRRCCSATAWRRPLANVAALGVVGGAPRGAARQGEEGVPALTTAGSGPPIHQPWGRPSGGGPFSCPRGRTTRATTSAPRGGRQ